MDFDPSLCKGCPFEGQYEPFEHDIGDDDAPFLVVTDAPSLSGAKAGRLLTDNQMQVFAKHMRKHGFTREDFRFTPVCRCPYNADAHPNKDITNAHKHCRSHFKASFDEVLPQAVIPLGAKAATGAFGRATKIGSVRGLAHKSDELETTIFPIQNPYVVVKYPQEEPIFAADIASFARYVDSDFDETKAGTIENQNYQIVTDLEFLIEQDPEIVSFDIEGTGLRWYQQGCDVRSYRPELHKNRDFFKPRAQILTMQFTVKQGESYMLVWDHPAQPIDEALKPKLRNQIRRLLCKEDRIVVGQNLKHDNVWLWMLEGIRFRIGGDTLMLATLYDENAPERNLDVLTKIHVPEMAGYADRFNAVVDKSRMWETTIDEILPYGCGDTDAAYRIYIKLEEIIAQDDGQWSHYCNVSVPGLNALAAMETQGMYTEVEHALPEFKAFMQAEVERQRTSLLSQVNRDLKRDVVESYLEKNKGKTAADALSLTRPEFLKQLLFTHKKGFRLKPKVFTKSTARKHDDAIKQPSVSAKDHLPYFFETCPFTEELAEYVKDHGLLTKSIISFEKKYIVNGKVRPTYSLMRTVTGRTSSEDPNGQNYPKRGDRAKVYRKMFVAPPGYFVCELDLSQAELRIAASLSGDPTMIRIYRDAGDIHTATAMIVMGVTPEQWEQLPKDEKKLARTKAKAVNFGFLYGMGWRKFIGYAKTQYGVDFSEKEAQRVRTGFFSKYKGLAPWHEAVREFAMKHKYVRSYSGRMRHLPMIDSAEEGVQQEAIRQAINSPVQEFGSSLGVMALGRMNEEVDPEFLKVVGFIHDAIVVYVKKEYLDWGMRTVKHYMQSNPLQEWFGQQVKVPIVADCGFGHNLGEIIECEGFSLDEPFNYAGLVDKDGNALIDVPRQRIPPNEGRLTRSAYTLPTDLEDEDVAVARPTFRKVRAAVSTAAVKRVERSNKQMVINRRNQAAKDETDRLIRRIRRKPALV